MKRFIHFPYVLIFIYLPTLSLISALPKSFNDDRFNLRDDEPNLYPVKRKVSNSDEPDFVAVHEEQPDFDISNVEDQSLVRVRRLEESSANHVARRVPLQKSQAEIEKELDLKRSSLGNGMGKRADRLYKRDLKQRRDDNFGIVYGNGRPIGILEPFPQAYEFSPLYTAREGIEEIQPLPQANPKPAKMDINYRSNRLGYSPQLYSEMRGNRNVQDSSQFSSDSTISKTSNRLNNDVTYSQKELDSEDPLLENNQGVKQDAFKVNKQDNTVANHQHPESFHEIKKTPEVKRNAVGITNEKIIELKSALNRIQNPGPADKVEEIEDNLRDILSDMGLIQGEYISGVDSYKNKRDAESKNQVDKEDENLEEGVNRIELVKATHETPTVERNKREDKKEAKDKDSDKTGDDNVAEGPQFKDQEVSSNNNNENDLSLNSETNTNDDTSGEILDGNQDNTEAKRSDIKANVANYQTEGEAYIRSKRQESTDIMKGLEKSGDLTVSGNKSPLACSGNEAEVEKKHNKDHTSTASPTSEKFKREQDEVEYEKKIEKNIQAKIDAIKEQVKREIAALKAKENKGQQRKKREIDTLLTEESSALDPQKHPGEKLVPHIRHRRNLDDLQPLQRSKRGLPDFSNLKNIDSGDYLELAGEKQHEREQRHTISDYEADPQENKYLPDNLQKDVALSNSERKGDSGSPDGLVAAETIDLNVNNQDDSTAPENNAKIHERSADSASTDQLVEKKTVSQQSLGDSKQPDLSTLNEEKNGQLIANKKEEKLVDDKTANDDTNSSVQKRSEDIQVQPEGNNQKEQPSIHDDISNKESEKRDTGDVENGNNLELDKSGIASGNKQDSQKDEPKRTVEDLPLKFDQKLNEQAEKDQTKEVLPRKRRQIDEEMIQSDLTVIPGRRKRASAVIPYAKSAFFPYRREEEDVDDEGDEFDDDNFDERSNLQKREAGYNLDNNQYKRTLDYQNLQEYAVPGEYSAKYQSEQNPSLARKYVARENADVYANPTNYLYQPNSYIREKRQNFNELAKLHGGGPMLHHLAAVRERTLQQEVDDNSRNKRNFYNAQGASAQNNIADLSASDLFGALPQSYDGNNLQRFKRVKRSLHSST